MNVQRCQSDGKFLWYNNDQFKLLNYESKHNENVFYNGQSFAGFCAHFDNSFEVIFQILFGDKYFKIHYK